MSKRPRLFLSHWPPLSVFPTQGTRPSSMGRNQQIRGRLLHPPTITTTTTTFRYLHSASPPVSSDAGIVEGVWIFSRHGDRSPGRCLSPAHRQDDEAAYWVSKLPYPDSTAAYQAYAQWFPLHVAAPTNEGCFLDVRRNPFGFLTQKGLGQLKQSGHRYFRRYNQLGKHLPGQGRWQVAGDFLAAWNVQAYSTNYLRTVLSAQSFLDGLLGTHCFSPARQRPIDAAWTAEVQLPNHEWEPPDCSWHDDNQALRVPITVRALPQDPLNAFDRNPNLIAQLVTTVMTHPDFRARDGAAAPLAGRLSNILPGLIRPRRSDFSSRSPSGINWVEAGKFGCCCCCCCRGAFFFGRAL